MLYDNVRRRLVTAANRPYVWHHKVKNYWHGSGVPIADLGAIEHVKWFYITAFRACAWGRVDSHACAYASDNLTSVCPAR